jgi:hypothetical protein
MKRTLPITSAVLLALVASSCGPVARGGSRGTSGGRTSMAACTRDYGATSAAAKIEAFFLATARFHEAAFAAEAELRGACVRTGQALGMSDAELSGDLQTVCGAAHDRLASELQALRASYTVRVDAQPPRCEVSVEAYGSCMAECEAQVDPGEVQITCEGGEIRGYCDAECSGSCAVDVSGQCSGVCEGACQGTCAAYAADGSCAGACDGSCQGRCVVSAQASCQGECRGGCSIAYREPYCTGRVRRPTASARCRAACDARIEAEARCTPGQAQIAIEGGLDAESQARLVRVQTAMREGVTAILALRERVQRLRDSGAEIVRLAPEIPSAAAAVSLGAVACATAAAAATAEAAASLSVSVEVSVSFSASVSAR